jgi:hexosaminidase
MILIQLCSFQWQLSALDHGYSSIIPSIDVLSACYIDFSFYHNNTISLDVIDEKDRLVIVIECHKLWEFDDYTIIPTNPDEEAYTITIKTNGVVLVRSDHVYGVVWALQTLLQLIEKREKNGLIIHNTPINIVDRPLLQHRGLLIDSARHHLSLPFLRRLILWMSSMKLNVLHWHLTDDDAFPILLSQFPNMALRDVYGQEDLIYTVEQLKEVVELARAHSIRIIPEFDMPGHAGGWTGEKGLVTQCPSFACYRSWSITMSSSADAMEILEKILGELFGIFRDPFVHLGGDEVELNCWQEGLKNSATGNQFCDFEKKLHNIIHLHHKQTIRWQEHWEQTNTPTCSYTRGDVYQMWRNFQPSSLISIPALEDGKSIITSVDWYLDANCFDWSDCWTTDPFKYLSTNPYSSPRVIGGEACVWEFSENDWLHTRKPFRGIYAIAGRLWQTPWVSSPSATSQIHESIATSCRNAASRGLVDDNVCIDSVPHSSLSTEIHHQNDRKRRKERLCRRMKQKYT